MRGVRAGRGGGLFRIPLHLGVDGGEYTTECDLQRKGEATMNSSNINTCKVHLLGDYPLCDAHGTMLFQLGPASETLLCIDHARGLAAHMEGEAHRGGRDE